MSKLLKDMELKKVPFKKLLKLELPELAEQIIRVVESHNPKELQIENVYNQLVAQTPSIDMLTSGFGTNPLSAEMAEARDMVLLYVSVVKFNLRVVVKENLPNTLHHAAVIQLALDQHLHKLRGSKNYAIINRRVAQFLNEITTSSDLALAIEALEFGTYIDKLQKALAAVWELQDTKESIVAQRPQETTKEIAAPIIFALKNMFKNVELFRAINPQLDYSDLFKELNQVITQYRAKVSRREASNRRKAEEKKKMIAKKAMDKEKDSLNLEVSGKPVENIKADATDTVNAAMIPKEIVAKTTDDGKVEVADEHVVSSASPLQHASTAKGVNSEGVVDKNSIVGIDIRKGVEKLSEQPQRVDEKKEASGLDGDR